MLPGSPNSKITPFAAKQQEVTWSRGVWNKRGKTQWVEETEPSLVPCARPLAWFRRNAPTSLVTVMPRDPVWENATRTPPRPLCPNESTCQSGVPVSPTHPGGKRRREVRIVSKRKVPLPPQLKRVNLNAAGIDIGSEEHWAAGSPMDHDSNSSGHTNTNAWY
jgi:hypothetical protein